MTVHYSMTDLCTQKSMHFLCLEPRETDKNILKFTKHLVLKFHFLLLEPLLHYGAVSVVNKDWSHKDNDWTHNQ